MPVVVRPGDCLDVMRTMPDASVHAIVTDPPYNLAFMSREWDTHATPRDFQDWCKLWAAECLRVLRPGGYLLAFGGTRTFHRLACAVEDAGFEIRDSIAWLYGSGFPKSLDVGKAIDKAKSPDVAADIEHVRGFLEAQWRRSGIKSAEVDAAFGFRGNMSAPHWFYKTSQNTVPTAEQWPTLLRLLGVALGDVPESVQAAADRVLAQRGLPGPAWALREVIGTRAVQDIRNGHGRAYGGAMFAGEDTGKIEHHVTAPATSAAREWAGWGTALKPSHEVIVVARKPLVGTVAANVQQWGCGALNIDATRAGEDGERGEGRSSQAQARGCRVHGMRGLREADGAVAVSGRAGEVADDLWPRMPQQADAGPGEPQLAGRRMDKQAGGLPVRVRCEPISGGSSADTVAATEGLPRTSLSDGADVGSAPGSRRDGASLERDQGRQPSRELAPDGLGTARQGAPADRAGTVTTSGGERSPAGCTCGGSEQVTGRWPANVVLDGSQADALDQATGDLHSAGFAQTGGTDRNGSASMFGIGNAAASQVRLGDSGGASRFFHVFEPDLPTMRYQAKAPTAERPTYTTPDGRKIAHATVKPLALIRWLVRLVTPPGGTVLDPFAGSGTTVEACLIEGFDCIAIEREADYLPLIQQRIDRQAGTLPFEDVG
jgi:DNA modification methylase